MPLALVNYAREARKGAVAAGARPWRQALFPAQLAFLVDPSRRKCALTSRRAGKTEDNSTGLIDALAERPTAIALYVTLTARTSYDNLWQRISEANITYDLGLIPSLVEQRWYHPKGGFIWLAGCKDVREAEKFRGLAFSLAIIDEGGTHRTSVLKYLIGEVLSPALTDCDAPLWLTGTPGPVPTGYFHDVTTGSNPDVKPWPTHRWSVRDNPFHRFGKDFTALERYRTDELGVSVDDAAYRREWLGEWCLDDTATVYVWTPTKNTWEEDEDLPDGQVRTILGIDLGYDDETAFVLTHSVRGQPYVYVRESFGRSEMLPGQIAVEIQRLMVKYGQMEVYCDSGGLGKTIVMQLQRDYQLPVMPAEKQDKRGAIDRVRGALAAGTLKIRRRGAGELLEEWATLTWSVDKHEKVDGKGHREGVPDHCSDALLYAYRMYDLSEAWDKEPPKPGTPEAAREWRDAVVAKRGKKKKFAY